MHEGPPITKLLLSKPLTGETSLMTYDGVLEVTLADGQEGSERRSTAAWSMATSDRLFPVHRSS